VKLGHNYERQDNDDNRAIDFKELNARYYIFCRVVLDEESLSSCRSENRSNLLTQMSLTIRTSFLRQLED
jgi:hypothetical protein